MTTSTQRSGRGSVAEPYSASIKRRKLQEVFQQAGASPATTGNRIWTLDGPNTLEQMRFAIIRGNGYVMATAFDDHPGTTADLLTQAMGASAAEGRPTFALVDGVGGIDAPVGAMLRAGIDVRVFHPLDPRNIFNRHTRLPIPDPADLDDPMISPGPQPRLLATRLKGAEVLERDHTKLLIASDRHDGIGPEALAVITAIGFYDGAEFPFEQRGRWLPARHDLGWFIKGPAVHHIAEVGNRLQALSRQRLLRNQRQYWGPRPDGQIDYTWSYRGENNGRPEGSIQVVHSVPTRSLMGTAGYRIRQLALASVTDHAFIASPFLNPVVRRRQKICQVAQTRRLEVATNGLDIDNPFVRREALQHYLELLDAGAILWEVKEGEGMIHQKFATYDGRLTEGTSLNEDPVSAIVNHETGFYSWDPGVVAAAKENQERIRDMSYQVTHRNLAQLIEDAYERGRMKASLESGLYSRFSSGSPINLRDALAGARESSFGPEQ